MWVLGIKLGSCTRGDVEQSLQLRELLFFSKEGTSMPDMLLTAHSLSRRSSQEAEAGGSQVPEKSEPHS